MADPGSVDGGTGHFYLNFLHAQKDASTAPITCDPGRDSGRIGRILAEAVGGGHNDEEG